MTTVDERTIHSNLQEIIDNRNVKALNYAVDYAAHGLRTTGYDLKSQCVYVLCNMTHWRGEQATRIRQNLKAFTA